MNYVILNGMKSTLIKGLLIQSLPPVSKPLMRSRTETIDGRDGDIVTKLGYSAYDKEMSVGLFGDFDIDEVIKFFDSEGTVIFSNEQDKFYKYEILEQIDFERLIKFRTATVKFHVQPFKYSAVADEVVVSKNKFRTKPYFIKKNGVEIDVESGIINFSGVPIVNTEIYIPLNNVNLPAGSYTLQADCDGTGESFVTCRLIGENPTDADSFGHQSFTLGQTVEITDTLTEAKEFKYLWLSIGFGHTLDFDLYLQVLDNNFEDFNILNRGNAIARPTVTVYGSGTVNLSINSKEVFSLNLASGSYITLDAEEMNAYKGNVLMNRSVSGDFNNLVLKSGLNNISWTGNVTQISVQKGSRWI